MSSLAMQQQALLAAIWEPRYMGHSAFAPSRGLQAYRDHVAMLAPRALGAAFPVLAQLLGADSFTALARAFWAAQPPQRGDLALWGATLPGFVAASKELADDPFLPDVASAEWALHSAATAPDAEPQHATLAVLVEHDPARVGMRLAPGTRVLRSRWPVAAILLAHLKGSPSLQEVGAMLRDGISQDVVVWRQGFKPQVRAAIAGEADFISTLQSGHSVASALQAAPDLEFQAWLAQAVPDALWHDFYLFQKTP